MWLLNLVPKSGMLLTMDHPSLARDRLGYVPALDGLRGLAVLLVMLNHLRFPWAQSGFLAVQLFFVLSGFLITTLLAQEWQTTGTIDLPRFWWRRALRLLPALFLVLAACAPFLPPNVLLAVATYTGNWTLVLFGVGPRWIIAPTWTLAIEGQFYLVWPFVLRRLLAVRSIRMRLAVPAALALASAAWRWVTWQGLEWAQWSARGTDTNLDGLLIGSFLGLAFTAGVIAPTSRPWRLFARLQPLSLAAMGAFAVAVALWPPNEVPYIPPAFFLKTGLFLFALVAAVAVLGALARPAGGLLQWAPMVAIGEISYGLYLWHYPVYAAVEYIGSLWCGLVLPTLPGAALGMTASLLVAAACYRWIEQPALRLKAAARRSPRPISIPNSP